MTNDQNSFENDRRADVRLASGKNVDAVVLDRHAQPITLLRESNVDNVSAGGLSLVSNDSVEPGAHVQVTLADNRTDREGRRSLGLQAVACTAYGDRKHKIRFKLVAGSMPASLLYHW